MDRVDRDGRAESLLAEGIVFAMMGLALVSAITLFGPSLGINVDLGFDPFALINMIPTVDVVSVFGKLGAIGVLIAVAIAVAVLSGLSEYVDDDEDEGMIEVMMDLLKAGAAGILVFALLFWVQDPVAIIADFWWVLGAILVAVVVFWYYQESREKASLTTITRGVQRRAEDNTENLIGGISAVILGFVGFAFGIFQGFEHFLAGFGDVAAGYLGELGYLATVALGYVSLGGQIPVVEMSAELGPLGFTGIALLIGGIVLMFKS